MFYAVDHSSHVDGFYVTTDTGVDFYEADEARVSPDGSLLFVSVAGDVKVVVGLARGMWKMFRRGSSEEYAKNIKERRPL